MPVSTASKYSKYIINFDTCNMPADHIFKMLKENAEKISVKGLSIKLLADDFFEGHSGNLFTSRIVNGAITPYHNHDFYELIYVIDGECIQYIEGKALTMKKGDLLLLPPDAFHAPCPVGDSNCMNILIRDDFMKRMEEKFRKHNKESFLTLLTNYRVYMLFHDILEKRAGKSVKTLIDEIERVEHYAPFGYIYTESLAVKLIVELTECTRFDTSFSLNGHNVGFESPDIILQYIRDNISSTNLEDASAHFGYTGAHLSRLVKKYTGASFASFVKTQRILRAENLLTKTKVPISSIPAQIGLDSNEYFCRMFKKINGMTPSEYRKKHNKYPPA